MAAGVRLAPHCPACGGTPLPELAEPPGLALCPRCGRLLRRSPLGLVVVGSTETELDRVKERIRARVAEQLGPDAGAVLLQKGLLDEAGADSLDVVELVMALEEELGIDLGPAIAGGSE